MPTMSAIHVERLSKKYLLGERQSARYRTLRESLSDWAARCGKRLTNGRSASERPRPGDGDTLWALDDVSVDIHPGDVVGVIGRNGAGKSTLLKVLSRITEPTSGRAIVRGRIGSLLEVGTGFHPELSGRENIFMNGSILGMSRTEIRRKFDEIVDFAGVERFLDTPVKRYSSGMYVRLAFSVAAFLEPEILIVDEVLAVGDAQFQNKCMGRMQEISHTGRTVLFVSHNLAALQSTCRRGVVLDRGQVVEDNDIAAALRFYLGALERESPGRQNGEVRGRGPGPARFSHIEVRSPDTDSAWLMTGDKVLFRFEAAGPLEGVNCAFVILDSHGRGIARFNSRLRSNADTNLADSVQRFECAVDELLLAPGSYRIDAFLTANGQTQDYVEAAVAFEVHRGCVRGRETPRKMSDWVVALPHRWTIPGSAWD